MHKRDYKAIAQAIKHNTTTQIIKKGCVVYVTEYPVIEASTFIDGLCDILKSDNPLFDKEKFVEACK
jgi:hypothetical protein